MSILAAPTPTLAANPLAVLLGLLLFLGPLASFAVARAVGVFRPPGILGPDRLEPRESPLPLFALLFFAFATFILIPSLYARALRPDATPSAATQPAVTHPATRPATGAAPELATTLPATAPTTQSAPQSTPQSITTTTPPVSNGFNFTPKQLVILNALGGTGAAVVLLAGNLLLRPGGLRRLGLPLQNLPRATAPALYGFLFVLPLMSWVGLATKFLWDLLGLQHAQKHELLEYLDQTNDPVLSWLIIGSAVLLAPLYEELIFRGHLQTALYALFSRPLSRPLSRQASVNPASPDTTPDAPPGQTLSYFAPAPAPAPRAARRARWLAVLATSLAFSVVHPWWTIPPIFFLSVCLGFVYERTGNLYAPILLHALFNTSSILLSRYVVTP